MKRICTVVGARPQFIKAASITRSLRNLQEDGSGYFEEVLIHTGQHYDDNLSEQFFKELDLPAPRRHLGIGSGTHGQQTGAMLTAIEAALDSEAPDLVIVFGDTNSTLAGALAAAKMLIPVAHVEAGLRSFNRAMPEEINRIISDHVSDLLFCPSDVAVKNLADEGIKSKVSNVGDVMLDVLLSQLDVARNERSWLAKFDVEEDQFVLATLHRAGNTESRARLGDIIEGLRLVAQRAYPVIVPLHPRTASKIQEFQMDTQPLRIVEPLPYSALLSLEASAKCVVTDSGGMQKEAYWLGTPCVTVRDETEWVETIESGWNQLAAAEPRSIYSAVTQFVAPPHRPDLYGDGTAGDRIAAILKGELGEN